MFNHAHSSLRNVIERSFGVLKMKWRILRGIPSYPVEKQAKIICACMGVHNFIRDSALHDKHFEKFENVPYVMPSGGVDPGASSLDDGTMGELRDSIAVGLTSTG